MMVVKKFFIAVDFGIEIISDWVINERLLAVGLWLFPTV